MRSVKTITKTITKQGTVGAFVGLAALCGTVHFMAHGAETKGKSNTKSSSEARACTYEVRGSRGAHKFLLRVTAGPFRRDRHRLKITAPRQMHYIDGKPEWNKDGSKNWHGTDGGFPGWEFYAISVFVDGKKWSFPRRLWSDCYEGLRPAKITLSPDGARLQILMGGSDGAGTYTVLWNLARNGRSSRRFLQNAY